MQQVDPEYYTSDEFLLSEVTMKQAEVQYRGFIFTTKMLCCLFEAITGLSIDEASSLEGAKLDEVMRSATPEKTLFHLVALVKEISEKGESIASLLRRECSH